MKSHLFSAFRLTLASLVFFSGLYTLAVWGVAQLAPGGGKGELITYKGQTWYANVGQSFDSDAYFNSRPSAVNYNGAGSGGSNKGPSNPDYLAQVQARIDTFLAHNPGIGKSEIPADIVTASGSGLDPHISPASALIQVPRIARVRKLDETRVKNLVTQYTEGPLWGLFGTSSVHVLRLNLALDQLQ